MSNCRQAPSASANDDNRNPRRREMQVTEVEETGGMVMMAHYDDARLNPNNRGNNSTLSPEQANRATRTANASSHAATNINFNENPPSPVSRQPNYTCSHCSTSGHRRPECPLLPCRYCDLMGHLGIDCPEMAKVRAERRQMTSKRWYENNRANRGWYGTDCFTNAFLVGLLTDPQGAKGRGGFLVSEYYYWEWKFVACMLTSRQGLILCTQSLLLEQKSKIVLKTILTKEVQKEFG